MTKVVEIIRDAMGHLRVLDANTAPDPIDVRDAIRALNLMMHSWEAEGLSFGWVDVDEPTDDMPTPEECDEAIGFNLAIRRRAAYGATLDQDVVAMATDGKALLRSMVTASDWARTEYPDLPWGEGQNCYGGLIGGLSGR